MIVMPVDASNINSKPTLYILNDMRNNDPNLSLENPFLLGTSSIIVTHRFTDISGEEIGRRFSPSMFYCLGSLIY